MRALIASSAMALVLSNAAFAESHAMTSADATAMTPMPMGIELVASDYFASDLIGKRLYMAENDTEWNISTMTAENATDWDDIGEIGDILVTETGSLKAVLLDIGGFLGIGEKTVAVDMNSLKFIQDGDDADEFFVVFKGDQSVLEGAEVFELSEAPLMNQQPAEATVQADAKPVMADTPMTTAEAEVQEPGLWTAPMLQMDGYSTIAAAELTADDLQDATVYGTNDETIGEIAELVLTKDGKVTDAKIDIGGFLGLGETRVMVSFDELQILRGAEGEDVRVYVSATEEQLKQRGKIAG